MVSKGPFGGSGTLFRPHIAGGHGRGRRDLLWLKGAFPGPTSEPVEMGFHSLPLAFLCLSLQAGQGAWGRWCWTCWHWPGTSVHRGSERQIEQVLSGVACAPVSTPMRTKSEGHRWGVYGGRGGNLQRSNPKGRRQGHTRGCGPRVKAGKSWG